MKLQKNASGFGIFMRVHNKLLQIQTKDTPDYVEDCVQDVFMALLEAKRSGTEIKSPKDVD